jgi:epoxyqueuosine reductase QueG
MVSKTELQRKFRRAAQNLNRKGDVKITKFDLVYENLMPSQQKKLKDVSGPEFKNLLDNGSIISLALAYTENEILAINQEKGTWKIYAKAYVKLNYRLQILSKEIADIIQGIPILPTIDGLVGKINYVQEFFPLTISHRLIGEEAGMGWRGKNNLIIHPQFSCAFRFTSVLSPFAFIPDQNLERTCGDCTACYSVCSFLKNQYKLNDYRENCRKYILKLDLGADVCGKCIKACYSLSNFKNTFQL